ncbi:MAG: prepilin-type N-terminal cleavage/methylation domain-containing protein [Pseudomonadota bacterium]|nr:prepilin-type N-terminal cleavage/methylation domain-containing protein [Pseudomonadota bacterium]
MQAQRIRSDRSRGFSYVEVMVAVVLVAIALAPALQAVTSGIQGARIDADLSQGMLPVNGKMEELLARPYPALYRAAISGGSAGGSDAVAIAAFNPTAGLAFPLPAAIPAGPGYSDPDFDVFISSIDPATGTAAAADTGLVQIRVQAKSGGAALVAYKARIEVYE